MNTLDEVRKEFGENVMVAVQNALNIYLLDDPTGWLMELNTIKNEDVLCACITATMAIADRAALKNVLKSTKGTK